MNGERVSYCFNKLWPDPADAYTALRSLCPLGQRGSRHAATNLQLSGIVVASCDCRASLSTPCLWPGPSLERDRHRQPGQQAAAGLQAVGRDFLVRRSSSEPPPVSSPGGMVAAPANQVDRCFFGFGGRAGASSGGRAFASASAARPQMLAAVRAVQFKAAPRLVALRALLRLDAVLARAFARHRGLLGSASERDASWTRGRRAPARARDEAAARAPALSKLTISLLHSHITTPT